MVSYSVLPHARPSTLEVLTAEGCSTSMARTWHSFLPCYGAASKPAFAQQLKGNNSRPEASALPRQATLACQSKGGSGSQGNTRFKVQIVPKA